MIICLTVGLIKKTWYVYRIYIIYMYIFMYTYLYTHMYIYTFIYIYIYIYIYINIICVDIIYALILYVYIHLYICINIKMSPCFPKLNKRSSGNANVELNLSNYETNTDLKEAAGVEVSNLATKSYLASLKEQVIK